MKQKPFHSRQEKSDITRQQIINAAVDLFYEYGYEKASLHEIASKVGISQAAIFYHFRNKEQILYTIIEAVSDKLTLTLRSCLSGNGDPLEKLRNAIFQHIFSIKMNRKGAKIIIEDKRFLSGKLNKQVKEKEKVIYRLYKNQLMKLQKEKRIRQCDLTAVTFTILGMINWLYHWYNPRKALPIEKMAEEILNILIWGVLSEEEKRAIGS